jgi:hypothetical protein
MVEGVGKSKVRLQTSVVEIYNSERNPRAGFYGTCARIEALSLT